ncbi:MAG: hypothetical protein HZB85_07100 [Deltaproteobacteria bacterium]|nr:hypothetical protein [Deltaproteobacteria bacterium]
MSNQGREILDEFVKEFEISFAPSVPRIVKNGDKHAGAAWSKYLSEWVVEKLDYNLYCFELPMSDESRSPRLDAAIWRNKKDRKGPMDLAIEWEWDSNKVEKKFPYGDFNKLLSQSVAAKVGLAIIQTRIDGRRGIKQAEKTVSNIKKFYKENRKDNRPVGVIEIRRVSTKPECEFQCRFHDLNNENGEMSESKELEMKHPLRYP